MSTSERQFPFNSLPVELQREVFVVAAEMYPCSALRLIMVARKVYLWVRPLIYGTVSLGASDSALFIRAVDSLTDGFLSHQVKNLCLCFSVSLEHALKILQKCTSIVDLALWIDCLDTDSQSQIIPAVSTLRLKRLSIEVMHFQRLFLDAPHGTVRWFDSLTHLELVFWKRENSHFIPQLSRLHALTHISVRLVHTHFDDDTIHSVLKSCSSLRILIIFDDADLLEETPWHADCRVVYFPYPLTPVQEWEEQATGSATNTWTLAEELIKRFTAEQKARTAAESTQ